MEKTDREKLKVFFLFAYVLVCVGFICIIWVNGIVNNNADTPYFYRQRATLSWSDAATETAIHDQIFQTTALPTATSRHHAATHTPSPTPTVTPTLLFTPEADG